MKMSKQEIKQLRLQAAELAEKAGLKMKTAGCGLFRLEGQEDLLCASQIVRILEVEV